MRALSHPVRFDSAGAMVTLDDGSDLQAAQLAGAIISTGIGERSLAPEYGLLDPSGAQVSQDLIAAAVSRCEPELSVTAVSVDSMNGDSASVSISVIWDE
jgi:phage baseplate assembly protein W